MLQPEQQVIAHGQPAVQRSQLPVAAKWQTMPPVKRHGTATDQASHLLPLEKMYSSINLVTFKIKVELKLGMVVKLDIT